NVLHQDGALGSYHWGEDRKRAMLAWQALPRNVRHWNGRPHRLRKEKKPAAWVSPLSRFRDLLPPGHWRAARHRAPGITAPESVAICTPDGGPLAHPMASRSLALTLSRSHGRFPRDALAASGVAIAEPPPLERARGRISS